MYWDLLERSQVKRIDIDSYVYPLEVTGLARLVFSEGVLNKKRETRPYFLRRALKRFDDGGDPILSMPSGYATFEIPFSNTFTAQR